MKSITYLDTATDQDGTSSSWCVYHIDEQPFTLTFRYSLDLLAKFITSYEDPDGCYLVPNSLSLELRDSDRKETLDSRAIYPLIEHIINFSPETDSRAIELSLLHSVATSINPGLLTLINCVQRLDCIGGLGAANPRREEAHIKASLENIGWPDSKETRARLGSYKAVKEIMQEAKK